MWPFSSIDRPSGLGDSSSSSCSRHRLGPSADRRVPGDHAPERAVTDNYPGATPRWRWPTRGRASSNRSGVEECVHVCSNSKPNDGSLHVEVTFALGTDVNLASAGATASPLPRRRSRTWCGPSACRQETVHGHHPGGKLYFRG